MHEPISWLTLERLHLGELPPEEAAHLRARIELDATLAARMAEIQRGAPLAPLPEPAPTRPPPLWWLWAPAALAAAAIALLAVWPSAPSTTADPIGPGIKGGRAHSLSVVALRQGQLVDTEGVFNASDPLKVVITCTPPEIERVQVVVFQPDGVSLPHPEPREVQCGNTVAVPGAFTLSPEPARVCALLGDDHVSEAALRAEGVEALPAQAACVELTPARR